MINGGEMMELIRGGTQLFTRNCKAEILLVAHIGSEGVHPSLHIEEQT